MSIDDKISPVQEVHMIVAHGDVRRFVKGLRFDNEPLAVCYDDYMHTTYIFGQPTREDLEYLTRRLGTLEYKGKIVQGVITDIVGEVIIGQKKDPRKEGSLLPITEEEKLHALKVAYHGLKISAACEVNHTLYPTRGTRTNS